MSAVLARMKEEGKKGVSDIKNILLTEAANLKAASEKISERMREVSTKLASTNDNIKTNQEILDQRKRAVNLLDMADVHIQRVFTAVRVLVHKPEGFLEVLKSECGTDLLVLLGEAIKDPYAVEAAAKKTREAFDSASREVEEAVKTIEELKERANALEIYAKSLQDTLGRFGVEEGARRSFVSEIETTEANFDHMDFGAFTALVAEFERRAGKMSLHSLEVPEMEVIGPRAEDGGEELTVDETIVVDTDRAPSFVDTDPTAQTSVPANGLSKLTVSELLDRVAEEDTTEIQATELVREVTRKWNSGAETPTREHVLALLNQVGRDIDARYRDAIEDALSVAKDKDPGLFTPDGEVWAAMEKGIKGDYFSAKFADHYYVVRY